MQAIFMHAKSWHACMCEKNHIILYFLVHLSSLIRQSWPAVFVTRLKNNIHLSIYLTIYLSICVSTSLSIYLSIDEWYKIFRGDMVTLVTISFPLPS